jgi:hypothetical protein
MKKEAKTEDKIHRLYRLDELDKYEVSDKDTDVRGYILIGGDDERIGKVHELIVDPEIGKVRYLDIKLDNDLVLIDETQHILIPIGVARLDDDRKNIIVKNLTRSNIKFYPVYKGEPITREYEQALRESHRFTLLNTSSTDHSTPVKNQGQGITSEQRYTDNTELREGNENKLENRELNDNDNRESSKAEIEVLRKERDIARAERDILKVQLEQARKGIKDDFYDHEDFDTDRFYENRNKRKDV